MDGRRFDALTKAFSTRRAALGGVLAALIPGAGGAERRGKDGPAAARCVANGRPCGKGSGKNGKPDRPCKQCCSRLSVETASGQRRCACKPAGDACGNSAQCCGGQCTGGKCGPCKPGLTSCSPDGCVDTQTSGAHCGSCGNACAAGQDCVGGSCTCGGASCAGCCDGAACRAGTADANCGINGGVCQTCTGPGVTCGGGGAPGVCGCTPQSDATTCIGSCGQVQNNCGQSVNCTALCSGCCDGATCNAGTANGECGAGGATCAVCSSCQSCTGGACANFADGTVCGTDGVCDDGRCFLQYPDCTDSGGCSIFFAVAVGSGGLNLCRKANLTVGNACTQTADCPPGAFCAFIEGTGNVCTEGCPA